MVSLLIVVTEIYGIVIYCDWFGVIWIEIVDIGEIVEITVV